MSIGQKISHYKVLEEIGQGGMGIVYKAQDIRLQRTVALKILRPDAIGDPDARNRFLREARAASALNHPNITTIYEIDTWQGRDFIVMEYIKGETLKKIIHHSELSIINCIDHAIQIAEALNEAHQHHIIHRDIKSENIIITPEGRIKVMDFGLAKIAGTVTSTNIHTTMGTIAYMSPEQTRGDPLDFRTDIWSFGVVLYEMITGELPFIGDYEQAIIYSILSEEPKCISELRSDVPEALVEIVEKALAKNREERFHGADELLSELRSVLTPENLRIQHERDHKTKVSHFLSSKYTQIRWLPWLLLPVSLILLSLLGMNLITRFSSLQSMESKPLTAFDGAELYPALSPDGTRLIFTWCGENRDNWDIYLKLVGDDDYRRMSDDPAIEYGATWSNDGNKFAFIRLGKDAGIIYNTILGGQETKLQTLNHTSNHSDINPRVDWSPDGSWLVYNDYDSSATNHAIYKLDLGTMEKKRLTLAKPEYIGDMNAKISPDEKWLAFKRVVSNKVSDLYLLNLKNNKLRRLTSDDRHIDGLAWTRDGKKIIFVSNRDGMTRIWSIGLNGRKLHPVDIGGRYALHLSIPRHSHRLAYGVENRAANILAADINNVESGSIKARRLVISSKSDRFPIYSPDGARIVFASDRSGQNEIYICNRDGTNVVQMTDLKSVTGLPQWSPCGKYIAFDSRPHGHSDILILRVDGSEPLRYLTTHPADDRIPSWSRDGRYIYFGSNRDGGYQIYKKPVNGGECEQITQNGALYGYESFDGAHLFFQKFTQVEGPIYQFNLTTKQESIAIKGIIDQFHWVLNPQGIYHVIINEDNKSVLRLYRYPGRTIEEIGQLEQWPRLSDVSDDGKIALLWGYEDYAADIFLVDFFQ